jgi:hypothetical protein
MKVSEEGRLRHMSLLFLTEKRTCLRLAHVVIRSRAAWSSWGELARTATSSAKSMMRMAVAMVWLLKGKSTPRKTLSGESLM